MLKFRKHEALCMIEGCLGLQEYQAIMVSLPWDVPGAPPIVCDFPVKICRLHRTAELAGKFFNESNWRTLCMVFAEKGMREPRKERTGVQWRTLPPKNFDKPIIMPHEVRK